MNEFTFKLYCKDENCEIEFVGFDTVEVPIFECEKCQISGGFESFKWELIEE